MAGASSDSNRHARDDTEFAPALGIDPKLADLDPVAQRFERRPIEQHLGPRREVLGRGQCVDQSPCEDVDELNVRVADEEAPRRPDGDGGLHREAHARAGRRDHLAELAHRLLHREGAGGGARAVVAVEPAGDRVAAEVDDVAAETLELGDERVKDPVQVGGQLLGAALRPELVRQRLGQRREARDVREQRRTANAVGHRGPRGERAPAVAGDVGFQVVERIARCCSRRILYNALRRGHLQPHVSGDNIVAHHCSRPRVARQADGGGDATGE